MTQNCSRVESLAGAIALGEASEAEREEYRQHIASCAVCLRALGGEREIERVMAAVSKARDAETWEPLPRRLGERSRGRFWRTGAAVLATALAVSFGVHNVNVSHFAREARPGGRTEIAGACRRESNAGSAQHGGRTQRPGTPRQRGDADHDANNRGRGSARSASDGARVERPDLAP